MIVDTTLLIDLLRGDAEARERVEDLEAAGELLWVPTPVVFELWEGIERADRPEAERRRVEEVLAGYTVLAFDARHAARAGRLSGRQVRRGEMLDPIDVQIAGTALEQGEPLLTRNVSDVQRVAGLSVESY